VSVTALLVSQDFNVHNLIPPLFHDFRIETQTMTDIATAQISLKRAKFAAVIVDCDLPGGELWLREAASSSSGKAAISFALLGPRGREDSPVANFAFSKPLQEKAIRSTLRIASGMVFSSYRRSFRCPLDIAISLVGVRGTLRVRTMNISLGGIAIHMLDKVSPEESFAIQFRLPSQDNIQTDARVVWTDGRRAALLFTHMEEASKRALSDWVDAEIQGIALVGVGHANG
jgi:hypothetical protein